MEPPPCAYPAVVDMPEQIVVHTHVTSRSATHHSMRYTRDQMAGLHLRAPLDLTFYASRSRPRRPDVTLRESRMHYSLLLPPRRVTYQIVKDQDGKRGNVSRHQWKQSARFVMNHFVTLSQTSPPYKPITTISRIIPEMTVLVKW